MCGYGTFSRLHYALRDNCPDQIVGIKDSSYDFDYTRRSLEALDDFTILVGDDSALPKALELGGSGAITGLSNLFGKILRKVYDHHLERVDFADVTEQLISMRHVFTDMPRMPGLKTVLKSWHIISCSDVRSPLSALSEVLEQLLFERLPRIA